MAMANKTAFLIFILIFFLQACDPGYGVFIANKTKNDIKVKVLFENHLKSLNYFNDSVCFSDTIFSDSIEDFCVKAIKDTTDNSYNFEIAKYKMAMFEGGQGMPDKKQRIIVDGKDTLSFENKKRLSREGTFMSKEFIFTIR